MIRQFPASIQPWPLAWILSDGIFDGLRKFGGKQFCIFLFVECQVHFNRTSDEKGLRDPFFPHDEHGQDRSARLQREDSWSRSGISCFAKERDRKSSPDLLFIGDKIEDFVSTETVQTSLDGRCGRFRRKGFLAAPSLNVS